MYVIPRNAVNRFEFFPGFGWFELICTLAGFAVGVLVFKLFIFIPLGLRLILLTAFPGGAFFIESVRKA